MIHRFSNNFWQGKQRLSQSPELKAWIAQVLRDASNSPNGVGHFDPAQPKRRPFADRVFREFDNEAECRDLDEHGTAFVPQYYEEKYAYPLIVDLNERDSDDRAFREKMLHLSDRNFLGLQPGGSFMAEVGRFGSVPAKSRRAVIEDSLECLQHDITRLRREFHIHTERVMLTGTGEAGNAALALFLSRPEWFGGAVILDGDFPNSNLTMADPDFLQGKRVFLANRAADAKSSVEDTVAAGRLLHSAGVAVTTRVYETSEPLATAAADDVNEWIMDDVCALV